MIIRRTILFVCGLAAAAFSLPSAYLNGAAAAHGVASYVTGVGSVAVVVCGMALGPVIVHSFKTRDRLRGLLLLPASFICFGYTLANSVGYASANRGDAVELKAEAIGKHERATAELTRFNAELETAKHAPQWEATAGCAAVTRKAKAFCDHVAELGHGIQRASAVLETERPGSSDAQTEVLSWVSGIAPGTISKAMPMWLVVSIEVAALASFVAASATTPQVPVGKPGKRRAKRKAPRRKVQEAKPELTLVPKWSDHDEMPRARFRRR
jgi:hypothetical protein